MTADEQTVTITPLGHHRFLVVERSGQRRVGFGIRDDERVWVFLDGEVFVQTAAAGVRRTGERTEDDVALSAPMPATVVSINVIPGARVTAGEVMIVLEAMKMELPIVAARDGVVRSVACRPGELVQPGVPLVTLDSVDATDRSAEGGA